MIKLPDNPAERKKIMTLASLGGLALLYVLFTFVLQPYLSGMQVKRTRTAELDDLIWRAKRDLDGTERNMARNADLVAELLRISESDRHILRPSLGNYLLVASAVLNEAARGLPLKLDNINEVPAAAAAPARPAATTGDAPKPAPSTSRFAPYIVNVSLTSGMHALVEFIGRLERENPYITVSRLIVMENKETDPELHFVSIHVQWPVWVDNDHPRRLEAEQIADQERQ